MEKTNCIKLNDDFVEVIIISKSNTFMNSDDSMLNRALHVIEKEFITEEYENLKNQDWI